MAHDMWFEQNQMQSREVGKACSYMMYEDSYETHVGG